MNALEAGLLERSFGGLTDTLLRKRMLEERRRERMVQDAMQRELLGQRRAEHGDRLALDRDQLDLRRGEHEDRLALDQDQLEERRGEHGDRMRLDQDQLDLRRGELGEAREERGEAREATAEHREALLGYQKQMLAARTDAEKFDVFKQIISSGAATPQALEAMSKAMSEKLGVEVTLKLPDKDKFNTREGHDLGLAEKYRERGQAALRNGGGEESERFRAIAERLERGGAPEDEESASITEKIMHPGAGPYDEPRATVTRKVPTSRLNAEMERFRSGDSGPAKAGTTSGAFPEAPKNPKERKADTVYQTPRGPMKWTGTGWVAQ